MNKSMLHVHHHLGLGDHIICNGLIRSLIDTKAEEIAVFVKDANLPRVARMFDDEPRIHLIAIPPEACVTDVSNLQFVNQHMQSFGGPLLRLGFDQMNKAPHLNFDEVFYIFAGVPFDNRWTRFSIRRDFVEEWRVLSKLNPTGEPYMFVHDDPSRGFSFDPPNSSGLKIIRNDPTEDIFSMIGVLENASEIHCMESSFRCLIESIPSVNCPLYLHKMVRFANQPNPALSLGRKPWVEV